MSNTLFINLDNLEKGNLFVTTSEGILKKYQVNQKLLKSVEVLINENCPKIETAPYHLLTTDAAPLLARGALALSVMAKDDKGNLPNWHWKSDTIENVDEGNIVEAAEFVEKLVLVLDSVLPSFLLKK
ncbi:hypothetical protein GEMRC1_004002 [Eukaryota sp. GEM-RC1]